MNSIDIILNNRQISFVDNTDKQIEEYSEAFHLWDRDKDGKIQIDKIPEILKFLGINPDIKEMTKCMKRVETDDTGDIVLYHFMVFLGYYLEHYNMAENVFTALNVFDLEKKGTFNCDELINILITNGEKLDEPELAPLVKIFKQIGQENIECKEFAMFLVETLQAKPKNRKERRKNKN